MDALELAGPGAIADRVALHPELWAVISLRTEGSEQTLVRIIEEIQNSADVECQSVEVSSSANQLLSVVTRQPFQTVFLVTGLERLAVSELRVLDGARNLLLGRTILFCTNDHGLAQLASHCPNIYSWVAGQCVRFDPNEGVMDVEERLDSLRKHYQVSDEQVIEAAKEGRLPAEPAFVEWLTLLGRGELLGS